MTNRLLALLALGFVLRFAISAIILPESGFRIDIGDFTAWAQRMAAVGPGAFYETSYFADYPPGYLYVLWALGALGGTLQPLLGLDITAGLVKVPAILADLGAAALIFVLSRRFLSERVATAAAALYLFNPGTIFNSSVWGQVDSVGALALLATIYVLARGWTEAAAVGAIVAMLIKFQFAFMIPVVMLVGLKRHLAGRSSDPSLAGRRDPLRVLTSLVAGLAALVLLIAPFRMAVWAPGGDPNESLIGKFFEAAGTYTGLSINAFNLWRNPFTGLGDTLQWGDDTGVLRTVADLDVTWQLVGTLLFAAVAVVALVQAWRRDDLTGVLVASLVLAIAFFALPTRVHERYLFPALALAAPLAAYHGWRWATLYVGLSASFFLNVYWTYTADWSFVSGPPINPGLGGAPMQRDPFLDATVFSDWGIYLLSGMIVVALGWTVAQSVGLIRLGDRPPTSDVAAEPPPNASRTAAADAHPPPAAAGPPTVEPPAATAWLSPRKPRRRLDRIDAALLIVLVLAALLFRVWRLDTPTSMHFDEVYHARSGVEWLANWREDLDRDTYEWTHPMLAKYLIGGGVALADPNRIVDEFELAVPSRALAVAPRRAALGVPRSLAFVGQGAELAARDTLTGEELARWPASGEVASLAYDPVHQQLLVGLMTDGEIQVFDLAELLSSGGERAPPPAVMPLESGLASVVEIVLADDGEAVVLRGADRVGLVDRGGAPLAELELQTGGIALLPAIGGDDEQPARVAVTDPQRSAVILLDAETLEELAVIDLPAPPVGPLLLQGSGREIQLFVLLGTYPETAPHGPAAGGLSVLRGSDGSVIDSVPLPGVPRAIAWQSVANIVYVAGTGDLGPELWTVSPHGAGPRHSAGFVAFDTTELPGEPLALGVDASPHTHGDDNARLLVATAADDGGRLIAVDAGSNAFAWRLAGVVFGTLLVALVYLLGATMFNRRRVAVLAGAFMAFDLMSYSQSRIAMNDIFVATFIVAAYLVFWQVWSGRWARSAWWALPLTGALIGLAAASKWVGFYALAGLLVLALARSQLGRLVLVAGAAFVFVVAGIGAPWAFLLVALGVLVLLLAAVNRHPVRLGPGDLLALPASGLVLGGIGLAFALAYPTVAGRAPRESVEFIFGFLARGAEAGWPVWVMIGVAAALIIGRAVRSLTAPASDRHWFEPSALGGFSWPWIGASLLIIPLVVYGLTYVPYLALGHSWAIPDTGPGYGWSVDELHAQMYGYHFGLVASHPASSPWWSWPLSLKPVWFYQGVFGDEGRTAVIYGGGNPLLFWAGVPAMVLAGMVAWRHRSLALLLLVVAFAFQWLPWTRIERATFAYHYFTALPFAMLGVAWLTDAALRHRAWSAMATAFLVLTAVVGVLLFPLASALAMPDWYINAARALPPWMHAFTFPDPPDGERGELLGLNAGRLAGGVLAAALAAGFALIGGERVRRLVTREREDGASEPAAGPG